MIKEFTIMLSFFIFIFISSIFSIENSFSQNTEDTAPIGEDLSSLEKGNYYASQEQFEEAIKYYDQVLADDPDNVIALQFLFYLHHMLSY